jgi:ATP synthase protein I
LNAQTDISINKAAAYRLIGLQLVLTVLISSLLLVFISYAQAYSAFLGGMAYILPNAYFVRYAFMNAGREPPRLVLRQFYIGEAGKLVLTGLIFAACFLWVEPLHVMTLFMIYIAMIIIQMAGFVLMSARP